MSLIRQAYEWLFYSLFRTQNGVTLYSTYLCGPEKRLVKHRHRLQIPINNELGEKNNTVLLRLQMTEVNHAFKAATVSTYLSRHVISILLMQYAAVYAS